MRTRFDGCSVPYTSFWYSQTGEKINRKQRDGTPELIRIQMNAQVRRTRFYLNLLVYVYFVMQGIRNESGSAAVDGGKI